MAYAQSIADIIRQEAQQRGQIGVSKAGLWPAAIGQSAEGLQGALNLIAQNRTRGLQDTALKQRIAAGDIDLSRAKREEEYNKRKEEAQREAATRAAQATSQDEKMRIFTEYAQQWEPKAYREMVEEARKQRESDVNIEKTKAETERARRPAPKQLISPGTGVLNEEGTGATYTQPFKEVDPRESTAGTGRYMDVDKGQGLRRYQFNTETGRYDIDTGTPPPNLAGLQMGMPQLVGTRGEEAVVFQPQRGKAGKVTTVPLPGETPGSAGPIQPRTEPADIRTQRLSYAKAGPVINSISELSEKINTGAGLIAKVSGAVEKAKAQANYNDDVAEYEALVSSFTPLVARALGHTGVLTEQDVSSVKAIFPKPGDSKTLRDRKVERLKGIIGGIQEATSAVGGKVSKPKSDPLKLF